MGMVGRALLAVEAEGNVPVESAHQSATWQYLAGCAGAEYACVVPLDHHPWGGRIVVAEEGQLVSLARELPQTLRGLAQVSWAEVVRVGGGPAL
jgi:hypothetical protein